MTDELEVAALGHPVQLGRLYDIRTGNLCSSKIFHEDRIRSTPGAYSKLPRGGSQAGGILTNLSERSSKSLNLGCNQELSMMCGLLEEKGQASWSHSSRTTSSEQRYQYKYVKNTIEERVFVHQMSSHVDGDEALKAFEAGDATHVVIAIDYGLATSINVTHRESEDEASKDHHLAVDGKIADPGLEYVRSTLNAVGINAGEVAKASNSLTSSHEKSAKDRLSHLQFDIQSDEAAICAFTMGKIDESRLKEISKLLARSGEQDEIGTPQYFYILPITKVVKQLKLELQLNQERIPRFVIVKESHVKDLRSLVFRAEQLLSKFDEAKALTQKGLFPNDESKKIEQGRATFDKDYGEWKYNLRDVLKEIHDSEEDAQAGAFSRHHREYDRFVSRAKKLLSEPAVGSRIELLKSFEIKTIRNGLQEFDNLLLKEKEIYVLLYKFSRDYDTPLLADILLEFLPFGRKRTRFFGLWSKQAKLVAVDEEVSDMRGMPGPRILYYRESILKKPDVNDWSKKSPDYKQFKSQALLEGDENVKSEAKKSTLKEKYDDEDYEAVKKTIWRMARGETAVEGRKYLAHMLRNKAEANMKDWGGRKLADVCKVYPCWKDWDGDVSSEQGVYDEMDNWLPAILNGKERDPTEGSLYFLGGDDRDEWTEQNCRLVDTVGQLRFYAPELRL